MTVQAESFHLNGHIRGFRPQTQKLASCYKTPPSNLAVKGLRRSKRVHATRLTGLSDHEWYIQGGVLNPTRVLKFILSLSLRARQHQETARVVDGIDPITTGSQFHTRPSNRARSHRSQSLTVHKSKDDKIRVLTS